MSGGLLDFVAEVARLVERFGADEARLLPPAREAMRALVASDDWLREAMAVPHPLHYQQHLLYGDPLDRFSVVSFVWGPGQQTPVHDHTVWGLIGMLRGAELGQRFEAGPAGLRAVGEAHRLEAGDVECVSPTLGDIHQVRNAHDDRVSISIHCYGGNIGRIRRHVYVGGEIKDFVSGYSNASMPNLWAKETA